MSKEKKPSGLGKMLVTVMLSLGIGAGGYWFYENNIANAGEANNKEATSEAAPAQLPVTTAPAPIFYEIEPFTVTLQDNHISRILHVGLTIQLQDEASRARLERYLPVVRSRIITELGDVPGGQLNERETKDSIRAAIFQTLEAPLGAEIQRQNIADVLFNAFVVQ